MRRYQFYAVDEAIQFLYKTEKDVKMQETGKLDNDKKECNIHSMCQTEMLKSRAKEQFLQLKHQAQDIS